MLHDGCSLKKLVFLGLFLYGKHNCMENTDRNTKTRSTKTRNTTILQKHLLQIQTYKNTNLQIHKPTKHEPTKTQTYKNMNQQKHKPTKNKPTKKQTYKKTNLQKHKTYKNTKPTCCLRFPYHLHYPRAWPYSSLTLVIKLLLHPNNWNNAPILLQCFVTHLPLFRR